MEGSGVAYHRVNPKPYASENNSDFITQDSGVSVATTSRESGKRSLLSHRLRRKSSSRGDISKTSARFWSRIPGNSWKWELIGIFICISTLVSIFAILLAYDQKPMPHNFAGVSLNTAISILATVSRATVISVAAQIIAQQKWVRFVRAVQPLTVAELYDDATRGPLGSFLLLLSGPRSLVAIAVASVTVLSLAFEPFVQQSLSFPSKASLVGHSLPTIRATTNISYSASDAASNTTVIMNALLLQALYSESIAPLQPACAASRCQWQSYTSAALCSSCFDALNQTTVSSNDSDALTAFTTGNYLDDFSGMVNISDEYTVAYNYSAQTNYSISLGTGPPFVINANFTGSADTFSVDGTLAFTQDIVWNVADRPAYIIGHSIPYLPNMTGPVTRLGYVRLGLSADGLSLEAKSASICTISMCAQEQVASSINGTFSRNITNQVWGNYTSALFNGGSFYAWSAQHNSIHVQSIDAGLVDNMDTFITSLADTSTLQVEAQFYNLSEDTLYSYTPKVTNPSSNTLKYIADATNSSAKIAQAFSNYFDQAGNDSITGQAYDIVPFVNVRWAWLCFPLIVVLICSITLVMTMYQSHRIGLPTWTTSQFPLLFGYHHRDQELDLTTAASQRQSNAGEERDVIQESLPMSGKTPSLRILPEGDSTSHYEEQASKAYVRLTRRDKHWVFEDGS